MLILLNSCSSHIGINFEFLQNTQNSFINLKSLKSHQHQSLQIHKKSYWYGVFPNTNPWIKWLHYLLVPKMLFNIMYSESGLWICVQNAFQQILSFKWHKFWNMKFAFHDFLIKHCSILIFEWQKTTDKCEHNYS